MKMIGSAERACAVAAAASHDLNEELTVIVNAASYTLQTLEPDHPARPLLLDLQKAARRCAWKASGLLDYAAKRGARPTNRPMESLVVEFS
jgi:signal transduction histidine kinase